MHWFYIQALHFLSFLVEGGKQIFLWLGAQLKFVMEFAKGTAAKIQGTTAMEDFWTVLFHSSHQ